MILHTNLFFNRKLFTDFCFRGRRLFSCGFFFGFHRFYKLNKPRQFLDGGDVRVISRRGFGTTFEIILPREKISEKT